MAKPRGGKRPGAGRPVGTKNPSTITKEAAREALRQIVLRHMTELVSAQLDNAIGVAHFMLRDPKTGRFERVTNPVQIREALNAKGAREGSHYYIYTKDPSVQAFTDLMNRAIDKPMEQEQAIRVDGELVIKWEE